MKHKIVLIFSLIIFSNSIASAKLVNNPSNEGDEEVKVLVLKKSKNYRIINIDNAFRTNEEEDYPVVIKIGDRFNIKKEDGEKLNGY